ncbi:MAG TPA: hypothetical protein VFP55_08030 [Solirubrobacteraceae bacterium]|nr:hypothetical protein [Solirubrobacteraceae bacterium]
MPPDLDAWLARPQIRVRHRRQAAAAPETLWRAAQAVRLQDAPGLGRLIRLRIPGLSPELRFDEMFRAPPFNVLFEDELGLVCGLVGRIWTIRRDYPILAGPEEFRSWSSSGTVRVLFANWAEPAGDGGGALVSETRVAAVDRRGRLGLAAVRPLISSSHQLIGREGIRAALRAVADTPGAGSTASGDSIG